MYGQMVDEPRLGALVRPDSAGSRRHCSPTWPGALADPVPEPAVQLSLGELLPAAAMTRWPGTATGSAIDPADAVVAIVSLGGPRRFLLRPAGGGRSRSFTMASGDLLVMGGACQQDWEHSVPKVAAAPPRMSVTFRRTAEPTRR